jgi:uncharacterized membrane protein
MNTHAQTGYTHIMYALHALSGFIGITSGATIVGAFVFGVPSIIAILMNYARRDSVLGSWLESHFHWQARTFWTAAVLLVVLVAIALLLAVFGLLSLISTPITGPAGAAGAGLGFGGAWLAFTVGAIGTGIWILYRVIRGWMALRDGKPMHV